MVDETSQNQPAQRSVRHVIRIIETFAAAHGEPVRLIPNHLGRAGSRIVLIGADGAVGDVVLPDSVDLETLAAASPSAVVTTWQTDTAAALTISAARREKMAGK